MENNETNPVIKQDDFDAFEDALVSAVRSELESRGLSGALSMQDVLLPGKKYRGMSAEAAGNTRAIVNVTALYNDYDGTNLPELAERAFQTLTENRDFSGSVCWLGDYAEVRPRLFARLISAPRNRELLRTVPHRIMADLAVTYSAEISTEGGILASTTLRNENAAELGVTEEQLYRDAVSNMRAMGDWIVQNLYEMTGHEDTGIPLFVITGNRPNGAANILIPEAQDALTGILGQKFMILPSSVHELICLPYAEEGAEELEKLVRLVNETSVDPTEVLGENVLVFEHGDIQTYRP